jgi:hypothetical protein
MASLNEEYDLSRFAELDAAAEAVPAGHYQPVRDLRFYPGGQLSRERREALEGQAVEPTELTTDDIVYSLARLVTTTMYGFIEQIERRWGQDAAREVVLQWARERARNSLTTWMRARNLEHLTAEDLARFQDYRHLTSGPIHAHSFVAYKPGTRSGEAATLTLTRTGCLFHCLRPSGMASYSSCVSQGSNLGYQDAYPDIRLRFEHCMSDGSSANTCRAVFEVGRRRPGGG